MYVGVYVCMCVLCVLCLCVRVCVLCAGVVLGGVRCDVEEV